MTMSNRMARSATLGGDMRPGRQAHGKIDQEDEISDIATALGEGARRAKVWGLYAVQLHGAHVGKGNVRVERA